MITKSVFQIERVIGQHQSALSSRLHPPIAIPNEVPRPEVCDQIFSAGGARLVLITAPPGFGKTTVMRQVRQRCERGGLPTAWLNLDPADNDVSRFLTGLIATLEPLMPGIPFNGGVESVSAGGGYSASQMLERIAKHDESFILFLDDFETIQSPAALALVRQIVHSLPLGAQLVIGSRHIPDLGLGRMRANGWLLEIDSAQLRFNEQECGDFLMTSRQLDLPEEDVRKLYIKTEGWVAALALASLAVSERQRRAATDELSRDGITEFIARFSGSDTAIADYLAQDVLGRLSDDLRLFLLKTSILNSLSAPLCDAVCERNDSQSLLEQLEHDNLFVVRLDDQRKQYRYHGLFLEFLRGQMLRTLPGELPKLHLAAARWYESANRPVPAIDHALASGDLNYTLPLLVDHSLRLLSDGRMRLLTRWLDDVPTKNLNQFPILKVIHAWAVTFTRGPREAMELIQKFGKNVKLDEESAAHLCALKTVLLLRMDRFEEAYELGLENFDRIVARPGVASSVLATALGTASIVRGSFEQARNFLAAARSSQSPTDGNFNMILSESIEGAIDLLRGNLRQAMARLRGTLQPRVGDPEHYSRSNAVGGMLLAEALYETNECAEAERLLIGHLPSTTEAGLPDQMITGHVLMSRIASSRGEYEQAFQWMMELENIGHRMGLPRIVGSAKLERARLALSMGNSDAAKLELDCAADPTLWSNVSRLFTTANDAETYETGMFRWQVRSGQAAATLTQLRECIATAESARRMRRALKLLILFAEAQYASGEQRKAMEVLGKAIKLGVGEGFVRSFVDEGETVAKMLEVWTKNPTYVLDSALRDYLGQLQKAAKRNADNVAPEHFVMLEELSRKELVVLHMLAEGLSNRDLAKKLFLSETTIRTHLRNINMKLGVHSRMQAVAVARRLGILA